MSSVMPAYLAPQVAPTSFTGPAKATDDSDAFATELLRTSQQVNERNDSQDKHVETTQESTSQTTQESTSPIDTAAPAASPEGTTNPTAAAATQEAAEATPADSPGDTPADDAEVAAVALVPPIAPASVAVDVVPTSTLAVTGVEAAAVVDSTAPLQTSAPTVQGSVTPPTVSAQSQVSTGTGLMAPSASAPAAPEEATAAPLITTPVPQGTTASQPAGPSAPVPVVTEADAAATSQAPMAATVEPVASPAATSTPSPGTTAPVSAPAAEAEAPSAPPTVSATPATVTPSETGSTTPAPPTSQSTPGTQAPTAAPVPAAAEPSGAQTSIPATDGAEAGQDVDAVRPAPQATEHTAPTSTVTTSTRASESAPTAMRPVVQDSDAVDSQVKSPDATSPSEARAPIAPVSPTVTTTTTAASSPDRPQLDLPVAQQLSTHLTSFRGRADGTYETTLRLNPEHLGDVTIRLQVNGGSVSLHALGASVAAVDALRDAMPDLRQDLLRSGLDLVDSQVDQNPGSQARDAQAERDTLRSGDRGTAASVAPVATTTMSGDGSSRSTSIIEGGRVDVRI